MEPSHLDLPLTPSLLGHGSSTASSHDPGERDQKWGLQHTPGVSRRIPQLLMLTFGGCFLRVAIVMSHSVL